MKRFELIFLWVFLIAAGCKPSTEKGNVKEELAGKQFQPHIEKLDLRLDNIVDTDARVEIIAEGFDWTEGPLWVDGLGLLFSDIPPNRIYLWTEDAEHSLYLEPSGYTGKIARGGEIGSNGLILDHDGNLVLCQHGDRRMARMLAGVHTPLARFETIGDNYDGKKFNSPNDACYATNGDLFFTDPPYGLEHNINDPSKELDFQGIFKYSVQEGLVLLTSELSRPNGIGLSPDEGKLYVANSDPESAVWMEYVLDDNGIITQGKVFYDATEKVGQEPGLPDGLKVDKAGNIFASGPGGIWIFNNLGDVLGMIKTGQATSNCAIGNGGTMLYITADMYVMRVPLIPNL
jgi:gluconolactonase